MSAKKNGRDLAWLRQVSSFGTSRIILTANHYRFFDHLQGRGKTAASLAKKIACDRRATGLLLNSLAAIGLLTKTGETFRNAPVASRYLVKGKPDYQGDILDHYSVLWDNWSGLNTVLKTGAPCRRSGNHESFILGMHNIALQKVKGVLEKVDLHGVKRLLDLGGGPGTYAMAFARKKIEVVLFDFPETLRIAERIISGERLGGRIELMPGDFSHDDLGSGYDLVFISQILHAYSPGECLSMLRKAHAALNPNGRVVIQEFYLDETRVHPLQGAVFAINMLVNTPGGRTYTPNEMSTWMKKAGFSSIERSMTEETVLISGAKKVR